MRASKVDRIRWIIFQAKELTKISKQLHKLDEAACNYGISPKQKRRMEKLMQQANERAKTLGLKAYHQGDPRGCSLYLVEKLDGSDTNYTNGIAIY